MFCVVYHFFFPSVEVLYIMFATCMENLWQTTKLMGQAPIHFHIASKVTFTDNEESMKVVICSSQVIMDAPRHGMFYALG